jgi:hypothetical protein
MRSTRLRIAAVLVVVGALILAGHDLSPAALATQSAGVAKSKAAPRTVKKAKKLVRQSVAQLARNYAKHRAKAVCNGLTVKARRSLGGNSRCVATLRYVTASKRISKVTITKIVVRSKRRLANVSGYLNRNRKKRLVVVFKWEGGRYLLDRSLTSYRNLLG